MRKQTKKATSSSGLLRSDKVAIGVGAAAGLALGAYIGYIPIRETVQLIELGARMADGLANLLRYP